MGAKGESGEMGYPGTPGAAGPSGMVGEKGIPGPVGPRVSRSSRASFPSPSFSLSLVRVQAVCPVKLASPDSQGTFNSPWKNRDAHLLCLQ